MKQLIVSDDALRYGAGSARIVLLRQNVPEQSKESLETFISTYEAVLQTTKQHDAAVFVAASEARSHVHAKPARRAFAYPQAPGDLVPQDYTAPALAGYFGFLTAAAEEKANSAGIEAVVVHGRTYTLHKPIEELSLVGLDSESAKLRKYVRQLFLYNPQTMQNPDTGRFPKTVLLTGPPGTGKTSLFKTCVLEAERLERVTGTHCTIELFDGSSFSSYFGKSARIMKQKLSRVQNLGGVGLFCIDDVDMVLQSREDNNVYHGLLQVQQYLMNFLSGIYPYYGNTLTLLTTNKPEALDIALRSRMQAHVEINPFTDVAVHAAYLHRQFPDLAQKELQQLALKSRELQLSGRDLESISYLAREATTREPTTEELVTKTRDEKCYATVTSELLETLIAEKAYK